MNIKKRYPLIILLLAILVLLSIKPVQPELFFRDYKIALPLITKAQPVLIWNDEFNGTKLDLNKWNIRVGSYDPDYHLEKSITVSNGNLIITANKEDYGGLHYTTGWITTKSAWKYGTFEMKAKLPVGKGLWPAFWMLSQSNIYGEGVMSGEIDIMELWGNKPSQIKGTLHYGYPWVFISTPYNLRSGNFSNNYHIFTVKWNEHSIRWYVDNVLYKTETKWYSSGGKFPAPFDQPFYVILNVGIWKYIPPDATTKFPQQMIVDWVRIYP